MKKNMETKNGTPKSTFFNNRAQRRTDQEHGNAGKRVCQNFMPLNFKYRQLLLKVIDRKIRIHHLAFYLPRQVGSALNCFTC